MHTTLMGGEAQFSMLLRSQSQARPGQQELAAPFRQRPRPEGVQTLQGSGLSQAGARDLERGIGKDLGFESKNGNGQANLNVKPVMNSDER
ncbi:MAG TPA: hypothetical protein VGK03_06355 [Geothrix sp.]